MWGDGLALLVGRKRGGSAQWGTGVETSPLTVPMPALLRCDTSKSHTAYGIKLWCQPGADQGVPPAALCALPTPVQAAL